MKIYKTVYSVNINKTVNINNVSFEWENESANIDNINLLDVII